MANLGSNTIGNRKNTFAILLATWNGERFLGEQLASLANQTVDQVSLWISDDGSRDGTVSIVTKFAKTWKKGQCKVINHVRQSTLDPSLPAAGSNENFRSLLKNQNIKADYYALCDQDDIWDVDKLARASAWLDGQDSSIPCLYCSRTRIISEAGSVNGLSPQFQKAPAFRNAIVQNIAAGNTIVLNNKAMEILRRSIADARFVGHDWWCYIIVTAHGGKVFYDPVPGISYRQHDGNTVGENSSWLARMTRLRWVLSGRFKKWNEVNMEGMSGISADLTPEARDVIAGFAAIRHRGGFRAVWKLFRSGIYRQSLVGTLSLYLACFLGKI